MFKQLYLFCLFYLVYQLLHFNMMQQSQITSYIKKYDRVKLPSDM